MNIDRFIDNIASKSENNPDFYINQEGIKVCGKCGEPLQTILPPAYQKMAFGRKTVPRMCRCEREKQKQDEKHEEQRRLNMRIDELRKKGITDHTYLKYKFSEDDGRNPEQIAFCKEYVKNWHKNKEENNGILFFGDFGKGKSFLAGCIANALIDSGVYACMTKLSALRENRLDKGSYTIDISAPDLLVIDDLGVEKVTETVFNIIDDRYRSGKPTIFTTNLTAEKLKNPSTLEEGRVYDRVLGMCNTRLLVDNPYNRFYLPHK